MFVVEKYYTAKQTWWRIYQSWEDCYSLREFMGITPSIPDKYRDYIDYFGKGKKMGKKYIYSFFNSLPHTDKPVRYCMKSVDVSRQFNNVSIAESVSSAKK